MIRSAVPQPLFIGISRVIVDVFSGDIHHTRRLPRRSQEPSYLMEALQDWCCLQMLLASIKEKKVTPQRWIQVCSARDHPNAIPQSILIRALFL